MALGHGDVLEIGSGGGIAAEWLTRSGYQYAGTDVSEGLIRVARERVPGAQFFRQEPAGLDFPGRVFDGLWASASLLHLPLCDVSPALLRIRSVLRDDAIGLISLKALPDERVCMRREADGRLFTYWSRPAFTAELEEASFQVEEFWRQAAGATWLCFLVKAAGQFGDAKTPGDG